MDTEQKAELLREPEVGRTYKFTGPWLRKQRRLKRGPPFIQLGRMIFYSVRDLNDFVSAHRIMPDGDASPAAEHEDDGCGKP
ncbi:MAG: hypothetical protein ABSH52_24750 [Terriglobia bacterium]|jgi:hypothetical protein